VTAVARGSSSRIRCRARCDAADPATPRHPCYPIAPVAAPRSASPR
jgi:hypothetical protein